MIIYSEKATKFCKIFLLFLTLCTVVKSKGKISQNFEAFSEYMKFNKITSATSASLARRPLFITVTVKVRTSGGISSRSKVSSKTGSWPAFTLVRATFTYKKNKILDLSFLNNRFLMKRGMVSKPKMEYQVFLCIFQKNSAMATWGLKEMGKFLQI